MLNHPNVSCFSAGSFWFAGSNCLKLTIAKSKTKTCRFTSRTWRAAPWMNREWGRHMAICNGKLTWICRVLFWWESSGLQRFRWNSKIYFVHHPDKLTMYIPGHRAQNNFHAIIHLRTCAASGGNKGLAHINSAGVVAAAYSRPGWYLGEWLPLWATGNPTLL